jgi:hypothetical protein
MDLLGNPLYLTRPYPYFHAGQEAAKVRINSNVRLHVPAWKTAAYGAELKGVHLKFVKMALLEFAKDYMSQEVHIGAFTNVGPGLWSDVAFSAVFVADYNGFNHTTTNLFVAELDAALAKATASTADDGLTHHLQHSRGFKTYGDCDLADLAEAKFDDIKCSLSGATLKPATPRTFTTAEHMELVTPASNPNVEFCKLGCTNFFSAPETPTFLSTCLTKCDFTYRSAAHISVGYSDLAEAARLECRDGCQLALHRCQPGYYCLQAVNTTVPDAVTGLAAFVDGSMRVCPPGRYRDVDYDHVTECVDCPTGRYREGEKGRGIWSCTACSVGKYVNKTGSDTLVACDRCPAGRFGVEEGLALCKCISEATCFPEDVPPYVDYPSPANAEKRESVPFEGRY